MTDITYTGGDNIGGIWLARFAPVAGIELLPGTDAPTFRAGFRWYDLYGTVETKSFVEDEDDTDNGPIWKNTLQLFVPGDTAERRQVLAEMVRHRFIVETEDNAGLRRRVGTLTQYLKFTYTFKSGAAMGDRRGATLTFQGDTTKPALVLN